MSTPSSPSPGLNGVASAGLILFFAISQEKCIRYARCRGRRVALTEIVAFFDAFSASTKPFTLSRKPGERSSMLLLVGNFPTQAGPLRGTGASPKPERYLTN